MNGAYVAWIVSGSFLLGIDLLGLRLVIKERK